jgi:hypothetical protein
MTVEVRVAVNVFHQSRSRDFSHQSKWRKWKNILKIFSKEIIITWQCMTLNMNLCSLINKFL